MSKRGQAKENSPEIPLLIILFSTASMLVTGAFQTAKKGKAPGTKNEKSFCHLQTADAHGRLLQAMPR